jgi:GNAT superfamily N-acetyltransferase
MELVDATVYYLEMLSPPATRPAAPPEGLSVVHVPSPDVPFYREIYHAVGEPFHWLSRRQMSDEALANLLADPRMEMHVLQVAGAPAGFAELDRREPFEIELVQFGLTGQFIGRGLGKWFLEWTIDKAWSYRPKRLWLHTCTLDHPAALPNYLKRGFALYRQESIRRPR